MKKTILALLLLTPLCYLLWSVRSANDPIKYIYTFTGTSAITILMLSLAVSPLKKVVNLMRYRKVLGLFAFFYALLHFINFYVLDAQLDFAFVVKETLDKPFVYLGMISFLILLFMALSSTKKLFRKFSSYHKAVYIVLVLVTIHASMAQKVLSSLEYTYIIVTFMLLGYRVYEKNKRRKIIG